ncbi:MAG: FtsX-like permease family protein [Gammaproteobacteria bacterium]|nr:FtsX-like permease family protein [Gammaproteobacteria bacterium]NND35849.1 ABC transporter permease [Gammaproteobacteria bacterium]
MNITLRLAWRNLWRQPRRTWLTTGAMVFSNVLLVFMISLQFGMYRMMIDNSLRAFTGHMQVQAAGYKDDRKMRQSVPGAAELADRVRAETGLNTVAARAAAFALASSEDRSYGIQVYGVQPDFEPGVSSIPGLVKRGRYLADRNAAEIVIGSVLARNLKVDVGDELTLLGSGLDGSFAAGVVIVVGIFDSGVVELDRSIAEMPLAAFQDMFAMGEGGHEIVIATSDLFASSGVTRQVRDSLPADGGLVVHDWVALQPGLQQAIQADMAGAWFMYAVLVVLVAFSVLNTQLMSVLERTKEFGIILSLGLTPGRIGRLVVLETALMGGLGLVIGVVIGGLLTYWVGIDGFSYPGLEDMAAQFNLDGRIYPQLSVLSAMIGPTVVFLFTLLASAYPALRLYWLHPVEAMRAA